MGIVAALGENALPKCGEPMTHDVQRAYIHVAARALAPVAKEHQLVLAHGTGPLLPFEVPFATILTMVEVDPGDPAFQNPIKFVGLVYEKEEADRLRGKRDGSSNKMGPCGAGLFLQKLSEVIAEEEGVFFQQTLTDKLVERLLAAGEEESTVNQRQRRTKDRR